MQKLKILFTPDFDTSLINKEDLKKVGPAFKHDQKWFRNWQIVFTVVFVIILVGYMKAWDGDFGKGCQDITELPVVKILLGGYLIISFTATGILLWAIPQYGRNNKEVATAYFMEQRQEYADAMAKSKPVPETEQKKYWSMLTIKKQKECITSAFQSCKNSSKKVEEEVTNEFLELILKSDIRYEDIPNWAQDRMVFYDSLYYWYLDKKERADGYVKALVSA